MKENFPIFISFIGGFLSFFSPCILPLLPIYLSYITGYTIKEIKEDEISYKKVIISSLFFIFGFTIIFVFLGASSTFIGNFVVKNKKFLKFLGGILIIIFGLHLSGILRIKRFYLQKGIKFKKFNFGYLNAFTLGIGLASTWTPCVGPILSSILILSSMESTLSKGIILLIFFSIGMGLPFLILSILIKKFSSFLYIISKHFRKFEIFLSILLIFFGLILIFS